MRLRGSDALWARRSHTSLRPKAKFPEFRGGQAVQGGRSGIPGPRNPGGRTGGGGSGHQEEKNVLRPPTVTGTGMQDLPEHGRAAASEGRKAVGREWGRAVSRQPGAPARPLSGTTCPRREGALTW